MTDEGIPATNRALVRISRTESGSATNHDDGTDMGNELDYLDVYCQLNPVDKSVHLRVFQSKPDPLSGKIDSGHPDASDSQRGGTLKRSQRPTVSVEHGTRTPSRNGSANPLDVSEVYPLEQRDPTQSSGPTNFQFVIHIDVGEGQYSEEQPADISGTTGNQTPVSHDRVKPLVVVPPSPETPSTPRKEPVAPRNAHLTPDYTIEFRQFRADHNCLASDGKRNELLIFNSELKKLIMLQHDTNGPCRRRVYIQWPATLTSNISDITYWAENGHYILSTTATNSLYLFDRANEFFYPVQLASGSKVSRVHCYERFVYCILDSNRLVRYRWDEQGASLTDMRQIELSDPSHRPSRGDNRLLDVTGDSEQVIVVYAAGSNNDSIRVASLDSGTLRVKEDFELDAAGHIDGNCIQIESTETFLSEPRLSEGKERVTEKEPRRPPGRFLYSNGERRHLKQIDLTKRGEERVTTLIRPSSKPTNACLLFDGRLVIMHDDPHSLAIYKQESVRS